MKNMKQGEVREYVLRGDKYVVECREGESVSCCGCAFKPGSRECRESRPALGSCLNATRDDNAHVIFSTTLTKVETEENNG